MRRSATMALHPSLKAPTIDPTRHITICDIKSLRFPQHMTDWLRSYYMERIVAASHNSPLYLSWTQARRRTQPRSSHRHQPDLVRPCGSAERISRS
jgi:hypothetical protein